MRKLDNKWYVRLCTVLLALFVLNTLGVQSAQAQARDIIFILDVTGSTGGLLPTWVTAMPGAVAALQARFPGSRFALVSHLDFPFAPFGSPGPPPEYAFRLECPLTLNTTPAGPYFTALNALTNGWGADSPESQYEAVFQTCTGLGRDLNGNGLFTDLGDIAPTIMGWTGNPVAIWHCTWPRQFHNPARHL